MRPMQSLIHMTLIACIWNPGSGGRNGRRQRDAMAADTLQQRVRLVGHVAIETQAADRRRGVMRVLCEILGIRHALMALRTGLIVSYDVVR